MIVSQTSPLLFDVAARAIRIERAQTQSSTKAWLLDHTKSEINDRMQCVKGEFHSRLERMSKGEDFNEARFVIDPTHKNGFYDCVISHMELHWINDVAGSLKTMKGWLRPQGLFMASMLGGETLHELRTCLFEAELTVYGGVSPRLSPFIEASVMANLMTALGYQGVVVDQERLTLTYDTLTSLMHDLRASGDTNVHSDRSRAFTRRTLFSVTEQYYRERFKTADNSLPVTVDVLYIHAWAS